MLGHSNGGLVVLYSMLRPELPSKIAGAVVQTPPWRLRFRSRRLRCSSARSCCELRLGSRCHRLSSPRTSLATPIFKNGDVMIRCSTGMSAPLFFGMGEERVRFSLNAKNIKIPLLMIIGGSDPVIDAKTNREVFERIGSIDKTLLLYPPMLHEPFNEIGREKVFADFAGWLDARLPSKVSRVPA